MNPDVDSLQIGKPSQEPPSYPGILSIEFPAIASLHGNRKQFIATWPLIVIRRILGIFAEGLERDTSSRLDLRLAENLAKVWRDKSTAFSPDPLCIAVNETIAFNPLDENPINCIGTLRLPQDAILDVCDGLHRLAALNHCQLLSSEMKEISWPIHFISVRNTEDLVAVKKHYEFLRNISRPVQETKRGAANRWVREIVTGSRFLSHAVAIGKTSLAPKNAKLWAESALSRAMRKQLEKTVAVPSSVSAKNWSTVWDAIGESVDELKKYSGGELRAECIRANTILASASIVVALSEVAFELLSHDPTCIGKKLETLNEHDWSRRFKESEFDLPREEREAIWSRRLLDVCGLSPQE